jgi:predicted phosphodiesterase
MTDSKRTLEYSDAHVPYHDQYALELVVKIAGFWQPHRIIENGDMTDFYDVSSFDKVPNQIRNGGLQKEIEQLGEFHGELRRSVPDDTEIDLLPGNHEDRLRRYLWRHSELFGLKALELRTLLELDQHRINFYPDEIALAGGALIVKHGSIVRKAGGMSALAELEHEKYTVSTITGHTHRIGSTMIRTRRALIGGWEGGCLCNLRPEYVRNPNWQQGVTLITEAQDGDSFSVAQVPFLGEGRTMKAVVEGRTVRL